MGARKSEGETNQTSRIHLTPRPPLRNHGEGESEGKPRHTWPLIGLTMSQHPAILGIILAHVN